MKSLRLTALAAALVLGACSSSTPTDPAASASRPSFDEGPGMVGSGDFTSETDDGGGMLGTGNLSSQSEDGGNMLGSGTTTTESSDTTARGGNTLGSGN